MTCSGFAKCSHGKQPSECVLLLQPVSSLHTAVHIHSLARRASAALLVIPHQVGWIDSRFSVGLQPGAKLDPDLASYGWLQHGVETAVPCLPLPA